jgi:hypothetical protein
VRRTLFGPLLALAVAIPGAAQDTLPPWEGGLTNSLGQPPSIRWHAGGSIGGALGDGSAKPLAYGLAGFQKELMNPVTGLVGAALEGYAGFRAGVADGGARALLVSTTFRLTGGVDYNARDNRFRPFLGITMPVRRGGVFGAGSVLRAEWTPGAVRMSVLAPIAQPLAGRTRQRRSHVGPDIPEVETRAIEAPSDPAELDLVLANLAALVERLQTLIVPYIDAPEADPTRALEPLAAGLLTPPPIAGVPPGPGLNTEGNVVAFHDELERAFSIVASGHALPIGQATGEGRRLAALARETLLSHVILPFNRLLGRWKTRDLLEGLGRHARGNFARGLVSGPSFPREREEAALYVYQEVVRAIVGTQEAALHDWGDSRVQWIPLQLALRPEEHDTQAELDAIVERAVGQPFTDGNRVWYVVNEQFQLEVARSILAAEEYHVLWIHDFRGRNAEGEPDRLSLRFVVDAYLRALTARLQQYDSTGRLPVYMIFLDQHYYEVNRGRIWLDFLERPLGELPQLPEGFEDFEASLRDAQSALTEAVGRSRLLAAEARQYGERWLRNQIKVHVNITNPAEPSFWSRDIIPLIGIPDNVMRDHRKIAFYDITEDDPYRGFAIYTGMGIGEHYAGPTWEDRSIMMQGPAALTLKAAVRSLLLAHGMRASEVPYALRPRPKAHDYDALVLAEIESQRLKGRSAQRAMELHNETGFGDKPINVAKAVLYTLMPRGSVIKVPDSLWGSSVYAAMLVGSALRGARVLFIAPSLDAAPSSGWPAMGLAHDLFSRLIVLQHELGPELEAAGGLLKTGIYNPGVGVRDVEQRFVAAYRNARRTPFLRRLFPVHEDVDSIIARIARGLEQAARLEATEVAATIPMVSSADSVVPKLHLKANFFASRDGWDTLVASPVLVAVFEAYYSQLLRSGGGAGPGPIVIADALAEASWRLFDTFRDELSPDERARVAYYLIVGSANQDYRSMFMDGEASVLLAGWSGVVGLMDFGLLANLSVWVDDLQLLSELLPPPSGFQRSLARFIRAGL